MHMILNSKKITTILKKCLLYFGIALSVTIKNLWAYSDMEFFDAGNTTPHQAVEIFLNIAPDTDAAQVVRIESGATVLPTAVDNLHTAINGSTAGDAAVTKLGTERGRIGAGASINAAIDNLLSQVGGGTVVATALNTEILRINPANTDGVATNSLILANDSALNAIDAGSNPASILEGINDQSTRITPGVVTGTGLQPFASAGVGSLTYAFFGGTAAANLTLASDATANVTVFDAAGNVAQTGFGAGESTVVRLDANHNILLVTDTTNPDNNPTLQIVNAADQNDGAPSDITHGSTPYPLNISNGVIGNLIFLGGDFSITPITKATQFLLHALDRNSADLANAVIGINTNIGVSEGTDTAYSITALKASIAPSADNLISATGIALDAIDASSNPASILEGIEAQKDRLFPAAGDLEEAITATYNLVTTGTPDTLYNDLNVEILRINPANASGVATNSLLEANDSALNEIDGTNSGVILSKLNAINTDLTAFKFKIDNGDISPAAFETAIAAISYRQGDMIIYIPYEAIENIDAAAMGALGNNPYGLPSGRLENLNMVETLQFLADNTNGTNNDGSPFNGTKVYVINNNE